VADLPRRLGTTFHVTGFKAGEDWDKFLIASVLENFFGAIWRAQLVVKVGNEVIAKETIEELFSRTDLAQSLVDMIEAEPEAFSNAKHSFIIETCPRACL
jgi:hypothetical protein